MKTIFVYVIAFSITIVLISIIILLLTMKHNKSSEKTISTTATPNSSVERNPLSGIASTEIPDHPPIVRSKAIFNVSSDQWILDATAGCLVASKRIENALEWTIVPTIFPYADSFDVQIYSPANDLLGYLAFVNMTLQKDKKWIAAQIVPREKLMLSWRLSYESSGAVKLFQKTSLDSENISVLGINTDMVVGGFDPQDLTVNTRLQFIM